MDFDDDHDPIFAGQILVVISSTLAPTLIILDFAQQYLPCLDKEMDRNPFGIPIQRHLPARLGVVLHVLACIRSKLKLSLYLK